MRAGGSAGAVTHLEPAREGLAPAQAVSQLAPVAQVGSWPIVTPKKVIISQ